MAHVVLRNIEKQANKQRDKKFKQTEKKLVDFRLAVAGVDTGCWPYGLVFAESVLRARLITWNSGRSVVIDIALNEIICGRRRATVVETNRTDDVGFLRMLQLLRPTSTGPPRCTWRKAARSAWRARWTCTRRRPVRWCGSKAPRWWTSTRRAAAAASAWKRRKPSRAPRAGCWSPKPGSPTPVTTRVNQATPTRPPCSSTCSTVSSATGNGFLTAVTARPLTP